MGKEINTRRFIGQYKIRVKRVDGDILRRSLTLPTKASYLPTSQNVHVGEPYRCCLLWITLDSTGSYLSGCKSYDGGLICLFVCLFGLISAYLIDPKGNFPWGPSEEGRSMCTRWAALCSLSTPISSPCRLAVEGWQTVDTKGARLPGFDSQ